MMNTNCNIVTKKCEKAKETRFLRKVEKFTPKVDKICETY